MRTTVELPDDLIAALHALAVKNGYRGYSRVMEEAVKHYLRDHEKKGLSSAVLLKMGGRPVPGKIYTDLKSKGMTVGNQDMLIAVACLATALPLLTRNRAHFNPIRGLVIY